MHIIIYNITKETFIDRISGCSQVKPLCASRTWVSEREIERNVSSTAIGQNFTSVCRPDLAGRPVCAAVVVPD